LISNNLFIFYKIILQGVKFRILFELNGDDEFIKLVDESEELKKFG